MLYTCLTPGVDGVQFSEGGLPQRFPRRRQASLGLGRGVLARPARPGPVEQRVRPHTVFVVVRLVIPVGRVFLTQDNPSIRTAQWDKKKRLALAI